MTVRAKDCDLSIVNSGKTKPRSAVKLSISSVFESLDSNHRALIQVGNAKEFIDSICDNFSPMRRKLLESIWVV